MAENRRTRAIMQGPVRGGPQRIGDIALSHASRWAPRRATRLVMTWASFCRRWTKWLFSPQRRHGPAVTSGIRVGTPALTTRGMKEPEMARIAQWIGHALRNTANPAVLADIRKEVVGFSTDFPVP